jgi:hypothetical protein
MISAYPNAGAIDPGYVLSVIELLETYPRNVLDRLINPRTGIATQCKFVPTLSEIVDFIEGPAIHKWSDGTMRREREWVVAPSISYGPNFTQQRLAEEEAMRAQGKEPPVIEYKSRVRIEHPGDHDPHWLTHPDPDAPWRKQGPPSRELQKLLADDPDYQANLAPWRKNQP